MRTVILVGALLIAAAIRPTELDKIPMDWLAMLYWGVFGIAASMDLVDFVKGVISD